MLAYAPLGKRMEAENGIIKKKKWRAKWRQTWRREAVRGGRNQKKVHGAIEAEIDKHKHKMGCLYSIMLRWWSMEPVEDKWEEEILQWLHQRTEEDRWDGEKGQNGSQQNPVHKDAERA